ncbi:MAG TPA: hypothetical protein VI197_02535 [Polyangiaceae bacterium]
MYSAAAYSTLNRCAVVLDRVRTRALGLSARSAGLRAFVVNKQARTAGLSIGHATLAALVTLLCPSLLLVLGPVLLGVPHVASDIRYLVLRPTLGRGFGVGVASFSLLLVGTRVVELGDLGNPAFARFEIALVTIWVVGALVWSQARWSWPRLLVATGAVALGAAALTEPSLARLVFAHAHNVIGLGVWYALFRPRRSSSLLPLAWIALLTVAIYAAGGSIPERVGWPEWFELHVQAASQWLAPGLPPAHQRGLVLSYAFLQSVHYAVWLLFIPQDAAKSAGSPTFCSSLRSAWRDFRPLGLALIAIGMLVVLGAACVDPLTTSAVYLFVTPFHGYLEVVVLACWLGERSGASRHEQLLQA